MVRLIVVFPLQTTLLIYIPPRSYRDALEAGIFTQDPADLFDWDVCVVSFLLLAYVDKWLMNGGW